MTLDEALAAAGVLLRKAADDSARALETDLLTEAEAPMEIDVDAIAEQVRVHREENEAVIEQSLARLRKVLQPD